MKKFQFKLQAVLTLRQRAEQIALENYSRALLARQAAIDKLADMERALSRSTADLRGQLAKGSAAAEVNQTQDYCRFLGEKKLRCEQALGQAELELNQALHKMVSARQDREAVEHYLDAQRQRHDRALLAEERKMIEDLVQRRARRGGSKALTWKPASEKQWN